MNKKMIKNIFPIVIAAQLFNCSGNNEPSTIKKDESCNPETFKSLASTPLEIYRGPAGAIPDNVWSLHTPSFGSYTSHIDLIKLAPTYGQNFANFLFADFKDNEPRYRQNLICNDVTKSCSVYRQEVVGGKLETDGNGYKVCRPVMLTSLAPTKQIADWNTFKQMLVAFDVRPSQNGNYSLYSAYCNYQQTFQGKKLFCDMDTPVDTPNGLTRSNWLVEFSDQTINGVSIKLAEKLYQLFAGNTDLSKETQITWNDLKQPQTLISLRCSAANPDAFPGISVKSSYNNCEVILQTTMNGTAKYLVNKFIDLAKYDQEIGELINEYNQLIGDESGYPLKRKGSLYFFDIKCQPASSTYKCSYKFL